MPLGVLKLDSSPPSQKLLITHDIMEHVYTVICPVLDVDMVMLRAAFTLAFFALFRASEVTVTGQKFQADQHLQLQDINLCYPLSGPYLTAVLKRSKTTARTAVSRFTLGVRKYSLRCVRYAPLFASPG